MVIVFTIIFTSGQKKTAGRCRRFDRIIRVLLSASPTHPTGGRKVIKVRKEKDEGRLHDELSVRWDRARGKSALWGVVFSSLFGLTTVRFKC